MIEVNIYLITILHTNLDLTNFLAIDPLKTAKMFDMKAVFRF